MKHSHWLMQHYQWFESYTEVGRSLVSKGMKYANQNANMETWYLIYILQHYHKRKVSFFFSFIFGCAGSSFLCEGFLQLRQAGATLHRGARASHYRGLSCCGAQAPDAQAQQLWFTGLAAPWHVGSPQTRARTRVSCIGRQILNHCATREAQSIFLIKGEELLFQKLNLMQFMKTPQHRPTIFCDVKKYFCVLFKAVQESILKV